MVPEGADLSGAEDLVERHAVREAHIAAGDLVREHRVAC